MKVSNNGEGIQGHFRGKLTSLGFFWVGICLTVTVRNFAELCDEAHRSDVFVSAGALAFL